MRSRRAWTLSRTGGVAVCVRPGVARRVQVNTGQLPLGLKLFSALIAAHPRIIAPYLGRGTAHALMGNLPAAVADFTAALRLDPKCVDALKRRAQCLAARGERGQAQADLSRAFEVEPNSTDADLWHQQGLLLYNGKDYAAAAKHFGRARELDTSSKLSWNHLGLCLTALGQAEQALAAFSQASSLDAAFIEAWTNTAQAYKELGQGEAALRHFGVALKLQPTHVQTLHLRGMCRFSLGDHAAAVEDWTRVLDTSPAQGDSRLMRAVAKQGLGRHKGALQDYAALLKAQPSHHGWYNREVLLYTHARLDRPHAEFNRDREMGARFKEGWCKRLPRTLLPGYHPQPPYRPAVLDVLGAPPPSVGPLRAILRASASIGGKIQLRCPGYLSNARQHRMAGLAALEIGQRLQQLWHRPLVVGDAQGSTPGAHPFSWRDMYDIAVRWRQVSEPNDPVWWVDLLSPQQFAEGFGSHTPMVTGQTRVVRYAPMSAWAIRIMRDLIKDHPIVPDHLRPKVAAATTCKELHDIFGKDFWVVTPCHSTARPGVIMEGTRLTIQYVAPNGYEHSIRTPGTPPRWKEYEHEMTHHWNLLVAAAAMPERDLEEISRIILTLTFYWYNFMPLSRGTAAVGFTALLGLFLSFDIEITSSVPNGQQVDWEGILRPDPSQFIDQIQPWLYPARTPTSVTADTPLVHVHIDTYRAMIEALNAPTVYRG